MCYATAIENYVYNKDYMSEQSDKSDDNTTNADLTAYIETILSEDKGQQSEKQSSSLIPVRKQAHPSMKIW